MALELPDEVVFIPRKSMKNGQISCNPDDVYGIIVESSKGTFLLIPLDRYYRQPDLMTKTLFDNLQLDETKQVSQIVAADLWREVPKDLITKDELKGSSTFDF